MLVKSGRDGRKRSVFTRRISTVNAHFGSSGSQSDFQISCSTGVSGGFHAPSTNLTNSLASSWFTVSLLPLVEGRGRRVRLGQHAIPVAGERSRRQRQTGKRLVVEGGAEADLVSHVVGDDAVALAAGADRRERLVELSALEVWIRARHLNQLLEGQVGISAHASLLLQY